MKIGVVGAKRGYCGSSTISLLIALWLADKYKKKVNYLTSDEEYKLHLNILREDTIFQDVKNIYSLLKSDKLDMNTISQFSTSNIKNLDIFPYKSSELSEDENEQVQKYILNKLPYEYSIVDLHIDDQSILATIRQIDILVIVSTQSQELINITEKFGSSKDNSKMLIINKYDSLISSKSSIRGSVFSNKEKWIKRAKFINYEPSIIKYQNSHELYNFINILKSEKQPMYIHLSKILDDIINTIFVQNGDSLFLGGEEDE